MTLKVGLSVFPDLWAFIAAGFLPTIRAIWRRPSLLLSVSAISREYMAHIWSSFGAGIDENGREVKKGLITPYAEGVVLDIGAGHGHSVHYLDRTKVTKYIALEPSAAMRSHIRTHASEAGFFETDGSLLILPYAAEDTQAILSALSSLSPNSNSSAASSSASQGPQIDTLISILTLCTIPSPQQTLSSLVTKLLKPGGQLLYYEHVLNPREDVAWWQRFWAPVWQIPTDGCRLDRPTHLWVKEMTVRREVVGAEVEEENMWKEGSTWGKEGEAEDSLWWHQAGRYVKK
ncbi:hypothetical protein BDQ12DRAFT_631017 [Crucibulum laeve]|uniref:S-adenosyl-L-methionine-dependent methyltransferase n=1 Tax=Crucibulum laeve TaxID=68775 RepID=A0A5C3M2U4_9AGAR|nr:hypothetical protein BDQ12DRAFT_631017 [Crucibulum laeve]